MIPRQFENNKLHFAQCFGKCFLITSFLELTWIILIGCEVLLNAALFLLVTSFLFQFYDVVLLICLLSANRATRSSLDCRVLHSRLNFDPVVLAQHFAQVFAESIACYVRHRKVERAVTTRQGIS